MVKRNQQDLERGLMFAIVDDTQNTCEHVGTGVKITAGQRRKVSKR